MESQAFVYSNFGLVDFFFLGCCRGGLMCLAVRGTSKLDFSAGCLYIPVSPLSKIRGRLESHAVTPLTLGLG